MYIYSVRAYVRFPTRSEKEPVIENDRITLTIFPCNRDFVAATSIMQIESMLFSTLLSGHHFYRWKRSSNDFFIGVTRATEPSRSFPDKFPPTRSFGGHLSNSAGTTRKRIFRKSSRDGVPRVILGRHYEAHQLFPCCHLQWPAQNEGGTDLRVSRTIITQAERHAVARFMGHIMARHLNDYLLLNVNGL